jgi:uncharacterized membrane protein YdjX (TVP38/TMEM64 family)
MSTSRPGIRSKTPGKLRSRAGGLGAVARRFSPLRLAAIVAGITVLVAVAMFVHLPTPVQMRDWAESVGPWFPLAFLAAHIVITIVPVPRTALTLASGLLFGPVLGVAIAVVASTVSAIVALLLVRAAGLQLNRLVRHRAMHNVDHRLRERGWRSVLSLRLLPVIPFAPLNYAAGASGVGVVPFTLATVAGLLPGTIAVVTLGDALTDHVNPLLYVVSVCIGAVGAMGLLLELRHYRQTHRRSEAAVS